MPSLSRRHFLGTSLAGLGAAALGPLWPSGAGELMVLAGENAPSFDTLFLTWRHDPTTTIVIQWVGDAADATMTVEYAPQEGMIRQSAHVVGRPFPGTDLVVYRCEIAGLEAGTEYKFQIGASPEFRFRTMPAKATDEFTFITGGDAGTGEAAVNSNRIAAKQDPYFVVIAGDLAYDNGRSPETFLKFMQNYRATMIDSEGRLIPLVTCLGNHEVNGGYNHDRKAAGSYLSVFDVFFAETSYGVLDFGDYLSLVLLDTGHLSPIAGEQTDWLQKMLSEREDHPHVFAIQHVPCYPSHRPAWGAIGIGGTGAEQRQLWSPLFERHKVNVVLEHHDHTFKRSHPLTDGMVDEKNGVLYLGDGSWGKLRPPVSPEQRPYLAKVGQRYHISMHRLEGDRRFHIALDDSCKIADVVTTVSQRAAL
ncbi:MAG: metallophosphoesterase family protein [Planctomycetaceae bacterium]